MFKFFTTTYVWTTPNLMPCRSFIRHMWQNVSWWMFRNTQPHSGLQWCISTPTSLFHHVIGFEKPTKRVVCIVKETSYDLHQLKNDILEKQKYLTKITHTEKETKGDHPIAEGVYEIISHSNKEHKTMKSFLSYIIELPKEIGHVQKRFHIHQKSTLQIYLRNPERLNIRWITKKI